MFDRLVDSNGRHHHIWCNHFMRSDRPCKMCDALYAQYPYEGVGETEAQASADLMRKHFPGNVIRS